MPVLRDLSLAKTDILPIPHPAKNKRAVLPDGSFLILLSALTQTYSPYRISLPAAHIRWRGTYSYFRWYNPFSVYTGTLPAHGLNPGDGVFGHKILRAY